MTRWQNETATRSRRISADCRKELGPGSLTGSVKSVDEPTNCWIGMWRRLLSGPRRYCHDLRLDGVLRDYVALIRRFALGFRLQDFSPLSATPIKNLREEVLIAIATENQPRLPLALVSDIVTVEVGHCAVVRAANDQCAGEVADGKRADSISTSLELFIANNEIEWDVRPDRAAEAREADN